MTTKTIYQTLEDRGTDLDVLEFEGPYPCDWNNAWFGKGFYFWDTFIENAHWWGKEIRQYKNGYIICSAICDYNDVECFDLIGNTEHLKLLFDTYEFLKNKKLITNSTTVSRIIQYMKEDLKLFNYTAVRAYGLRSKNYNSEFNFSLLFETNKQPYLDLKPAIQICFYNKKSLNLRNFKIIYPPEYTADYLV